jgi:hypothetical protein
MSAPATGRTAASASTWTASFRAVASLAMFVASFLIFLFAPLLALAVALLGYLALRGRSGQGEAAPSAPPAAPTSSGFGSGAA